MTAVVYTAFDHLLTHLVTSLGVSLRDGFTLYAVATFRNYRNQETVIAVRKAGHLDH